MKKIFRNLKFGLMLCAGAFAASCSDVDDAMDEIPYTRVLTPLNFEAEVVASAGTDITFKWSAVTNAEAYVLELFEATVTTSEDGNEDFVAPDYDTATPYGEPFEVGKDEVPFVVKNLPVDMTFFARVRGVSETLGNSHWAYLAEPISTSAVRSMLNPAVTERTDRSVTIVWDNAEDKTDLTSLRYELVVPVEGVSPTLIALSDEQKNDCKIVIEGLDPCTDYKFTLLFGKSGSRGSVTAWTRPNTEGAQEIKSQSELIAALQGASGDLKLKLAYNGGQTYDLSSLMTLNNDAYDPFEFGYNLEIYGESTPEGAKPTVKLALKTTSSCGKLHFEDLAIDGGSMCGYTVTTGSALTDAEFINCEMFGFTKGIWSGSDGFNVDNLIFNGIYAHDINASGSVGGDFIDLRIKSGTTYGTVEIKNSTFYACARTFFRCREGSGIDRIEVANCTFNQVTATNTSSNNSGVFEFQKFTPSIFNLKSCVFLNMVNPNEKAEKSGYWTKLTGNKNTNVAPTCESNIFYNVGLSDKDLNGGLNTFFDLKSIDLAGNTFSQELALKEGGQILADDPCVNSIAGKMYLKANSVISANRAGDPRWWNASQPVVVRPTELETVMAGYTWDFTEKTKFDTETIASNQIIDNIRIYAPAEVVMGEGVTFAAAGTLDNKNVPTSGALGFRADGYGTVEVTALGNGITAIVQVIAGGEAYSVKADGQPHKVALGDLIGANDIYVLAGAPVTFTKVAWSKTIDTAGSDKTALAKPVVTLDATTIDTGAEQAITATWGGVDNAVSYEVTFNGGSPVSVTEPKFVIEAAVVKALTAGEYAISVIAKPTPTSTKFSDSEAGEATFKVKNKVVGEKTSYLWDFKNDATTFPSETLTTTKDFTSADGRALTFFATAAKTITIENAKRIKMGGGSSFDSSGKAEARVLGFTAKGPGTLTFVHASGNSSGTGRMTTARINGVEVTGCSAEAPTSGFGADTATVSWDLDTQANDVVYICVNGGINFESVKWEEIEQ